MAKAIKPGRFGWVVPVVALVFLVWVFDRCTTPVDDLEDAGKEIAAALQAFKGRTGRFPARLEELVPTHLPMLPRAGKYFSIVYAAEPDGSQCFLAYQNHRDRFEEYDCSKQDWSNYEIEDSHVVRYPKAQRLEAEMWRRTPGK